MSKHKRVIFITVFTLFSGSIFFHDEVKADSLSNEFNHTQIETTHETPFIDLNSSNWAFVPIMELVNKGYMDGYEDGTFQPNKYVTRAEAASVIARSLGLPLESKFPLKAKDLSTSYPYYNEIRKLAELGIIQNSEYFRPEEPLSRAQIAKMIASAYEVEVDKVNKTSFKDYPADFWAKDYIESLADVEIIKGTTETTFCPNNFVTRAQLSVLVTRGMEFQQQVRNYEIAYDYLSKHYISTKNTAIDWTNEVVALVNAERAKAGVEPLEQDIALNQLAIIKAQDMIQRGYFDHISPYYGHPWDMATLFDYEFTRFGENIARNFNHPKDVIAAWMASENHRENMLREHYTHIGVGIKVDSLGNYYWVQLFSSK